MKVRWILLILGIVFLLISGFIYLIIHQEISNSIAFLFLLAGLGLIIWAIFTE